MYEIAKALHFLGVAMFLGSILGHVSIGFVPGAHDQAQAILFGRQAVGDDLLDVALKIIQGHGSLEAFEVLAGRERMFNALNLILAFATIFVAALKPALGQPRN